MTRTPDRALGDLARVLRQALQLSAQMRADGVPAVDRVAFVAQALKAAWPKTREEPWHFLCETCEDAGWIPQVCVDRSCGRPFKFPHQAADDWTGRGRCQPGHTYVVPCTCAKGLSYRAALYPVVEIPPAKPVRQRTFRKFGR